jgi:hypothetical protein
MTLWAISGALALLGCQDQAPPHPKYEAKLTLTLAEKGSEFVFNVEGKTTLPKGVVARLRVYAVELVPQFQGGTREDEEPLVWEDDDEGQKPYQKITTDGAPFHVEVYRFTRRPWALLYRARLIYNTRDQSDDILKLLGEEDCSWHADMKYGDDKLLLAQTRERVAEVVEDLDRLEASFQDFRKSYAAHAAKLDVDAWKEWKAVWFGRVERLTERNKLRYGLWAVWMERQAKMRLGGMAELQRRMLVSANEDLLEKQEGAAARVKQIVDAYEGYFEEAVEVLGVERPLDPEKIGPLVSAYESALKPLRTSALEGKIPPADTVAEVRGAALSAILKIPQLLKTRKRGYAYANDLSARFTALLAAAEASPDAFRKSFEEHEEALRAFKHFAGLK